MQYVLLLGRVLFSSIFILASLGHFSRQAVDMAAGQGVPLPFLLVPLFGLIALLGGISVLLGYKARWGAWLLVLFLLMSTFLSHPFWNEQDELFATIEQILFFKNIPLLGAALMVTYFGSGSLSLDQVFAHKRRD